MDGEMMLENCQQHPAQNKSTSVSNHFSSIPILINLHTRILPCNNYLEFINVILGECKKCLCNGHAATCDPFTLACSACEHNTMGDHCETCIKGKLTLHFGTQCL